MQGSRGKDSVHDVRNTTREAPDVDGVRFECFLAVHVWTDDFDEVMQHFEVVLGCEC